MKKRLTGRQEKILDNIKETQPNLTLIDHNDYANLWYPQVFEISNPSRFYRETSQKIKQSLIDISFSSPII